MMNPIRQFLVNISSINGQFRHTGFIPSSILSYSKRMTVSTSAVLSSWRSLHQNKNYLMHRSITRTYDEMMPEKQRVRYHGICCFRLSSSVTWSPPPPTVQSDVDLAAKRNRVNGYQRGSLAPLLVLVTSSFLQRNQLSISLLNATGSCEFSCRPYSSIPNSQLLLDDIIVSKACSQRINALNKEGHTKRHLRVLVESGGCSGFQYVFNMEVTDADTINLDDDSIFERDGAKVVVDSVSMDFIRGSTIDFVEELIRSSFAVMNNPNSESGCGCGTSFAMKI